MLSTYLYLRIIFKYFKAFIKDITNFTYIRWSN